MDSPQEPKIFNLFPHHKSWQQCYKSYIKALHDKSGSMTSCEVRQSILKGFFIDPTKAPDAYTRLEVERWLDLPGKNGAAKPGTRRHRLIVLRTFYKFAAAYDVPFRKGTRALLHKPPPTRGIETNKVEAQPRPFTEEDLRKFFAAIDTTTLTGKRNRALFLFYFWTARRRAEIARLLWRDLERSEEHTSELQSPDHLVCRLLL